MTFKEITDALHSKKNCSLTLNVLGGVLHLENLHKYVTETKQIVGKLDFSKERHIAEMHKAQLLVILENYDKATKNPPGWKRR